MSKSTAGTISAQSLFSCSAYSEDTEPPPIRVVESYRRPRDGTLLTNLARSCHDPCCLNDEELEREQNELDKDIVGMVHLHSLLDTPCRMPMIDTDSITTRNTTAFSVDHSVKNKTLYKAAVQVDKSIVQAADKINQVFDAAGQSIVGACVPGKEPRSSRRKTKALTSGTPTVEVKQAWDGSDTIVGTTDGLKENMIVNVPKSEEDDDQKAEESSAKTKKKSWRLFRRKDGRFPFRNRGSPRTEPQRYVKNQEQVRMENNQSVHIVQMRRIPTAALSISYETY